MIDENICEKIDSAGVKSIQVFSVSRERMGDFEKTENVDFVVKQNANEFLGLEISPHYTHRKPLSAFESLKKIFAPVASAILPS